MKKLCIHRERGEREMSCSSLESTTNNSEDRRAGHWKRSGGREGRGGIALRRDCCLLLLLIFKTRSSVLNSYCVTLHVMVTRKSSRFSQFANESCDGHGESDLETRDALILRIISFHFWCFDVWKKEENSDHKSCWEQTISFLPLLSLSLTSLPFF